MKNLVIILLLCCITRLHAQVHEGTRLALMQGVWNCFTNDETSNFKIVKGKDCLDFAYEPSDKLDFTLFEMMIGFQNIVTEYNDIELINIDSLKENGLYYTEIIDKKDIRLDGTIDKAFCNIPSYYECDGSVLSINGGKLFEYRKISKLPYEALKKLYYRGGIDNRDYLKEYLDLNVSEIKKDNSKLYDEKRQKVVKKLKKGDIVIILQEEGKWLKVEYGEEYTKGWIKKEVIK